jgi:hypothetical protein
MVLHLPIDSTGQRTMSLLLAVRKHLEVLYGDAASIQYIRVSSCKRPGVLAACPGARCSQLGQNFQGQRLMSAEHDTYANLRQQFIWCSR